MGWTVKDAQKQFRRLNRRYFDGRLAEPDEIVFVPFGESGELITSSGDWAAVGRLQDGEVLLEMRDLSRTIMDFEEMWRLNLAHEMTHLKAGIVSEHSKKWRGAVQDLARRGFLLEII